MERFDLFYRLMKSVFALLTICRRTSAITTRRITDQIVKRSDCEVIPMMRRTTRHSTLVLISGLCQHFFSQQILQQMAIIRLVCFQCISFALYRPILPSLIYFFTYHKPTSYLLIHRVLYNNRDNVSCGSRR